MVRGSKGGWEGFYLSGGIALNPASAGLVLPPNSIWEHCGVPGTAFGTAAWADNASKGVGNGSTPLRALARPSDGQLSAEPSAFFLVVVAPEGVTVEISALDDIGEAAKRRKAGRIRYTTSLIS